MFSVLFVVLNHHDGILYHMDPVFSDLHGALEVRYWELREEGVSAFVKHAPTVTAEKEDCLWQSKVIHYHNPLALLRAVLAKRFASDVGKKRSQFIRSYDPDHYTYIENGSKNCSGTNTKEANKIFPVFTCLETKPRCLVYLLDNYFEKSPP